MEDYHKKEFFKKISLFYKYFLKLFNIMSMCRLAIIFCNEEYVMDGIANVARQQQSQVGVSEAQGRAAQEVQQQVQQPQKVDVVKEMQKSGSSSEAKINSKEQVQELVDKLNRAMSPMNTNLKFGVDSQDVFYVSVIESQTNKMIRRFPAEQAQDFLPKMQEVTGILFDSKG